MQNIGGILKDHPLAKLVQPDNFVGWVYGIGYDRASIMTNDLWKANALGIPHNCFLIAASFKPDEFQKAKMADQEVLLLRVIGSSKLPQDDDLVRTRVDFFQQQTQKFDARAYDDITQNQMQFGGLECRILGTFYVNDGGELCLGSDIESFAMAARLNVYRPRGESLLTIVNHVDPLRRKASAAEAAALGLKKPIDPFQIGTVRYTSTDRVHRAGAAEKVPVRVQPSDFLARRTAVLGMTRTGKSNMVKQMVSVVKRVADQGGVKIGQIIYDLNGEYANANQQDKGALADIFPKDTVRYRMLQTESFLELQNNFYVQLAEGFSLIRHVLADSNVKSSAADMGVFMNMSLDQPDPQDKSEHTRWTVKVAAYRALLSKAGFPAPPKFTVKFDANVKVRDAVLDKTTPSRRTLRAASPLTKLSDGSWRRGRRTRLPSLRVRVASHGWMRRRRRSSIFSRRRTRTTPSSSATKSSPRHSAITRQDVMPRLATRFTRTCRTARSLSWTSRWATPRSGRGSASRLRRRSSRSR